MYDSQKLSTAEQFSFQICYHNSISLLNQLSKKVKNTESKPVLWDLPHTKTKGSDWSPKLAPKPLWPFVTQAPYFQCWTQIQTGPGLLPCDNIQKTKDGGCHMSPRLVTWCWVCYICKPRHLSLSPTSESLITHTTCHYTQLFFLWHNS